MPFLPFFEHDVFVAYSQGEEGETTLKDWTLTLIDDLEANIRAVDVEFDQLDIWRHAQDASIRTCDNARAKVERSGILMIVMSPRFLASSWCRDEVNIPRQSRGLY
jgi:hypothetical protein